MIITDGKTETWNILSVGVEHTCNSSLKVSFSIKRNAYMSKSRKNSPLYEIKNKTLKKIN